MTTTTIIMIIAITHLNKCLDNGKRTERMAKGITCLTLKEEKKGNETSNFRLIMCLPIMWKLFIGILADQVYEQKVLPDKQKGCRRQSRGTKDQLAIDKTVMKNCRRRLTNFSVAWIH